MITEHPTAIEEIVNTFHSQKMPNVDEETQTWILLEILSAIPEQVKYMIRIGFFFFFFLFESFPLLFRQMLCTRQPNVLQFMPK